MNRDETHSKLNPSLSAGGASLDDIRTLMRRPEALMRAATKARKSMPLESTASHESSALKRDRRTDAIDDSHLSPFAKQLRLEKRRADRTKSPLSIVLFRAEGNGSSVAGTVKRLCGVVQCNRRETDIASQIAEDVVAILLLDTNEDGAGSFTQKILGHASELPLSVIAQSYPGHLFDNLLSGGEDVADFRAFVPDPLTTAPDRPRTIPSVLTAAKERWLGMLGVALD